MKKKAFKGQLTLKKQNVATFETAKVLGGSVNFCSPATFNRDCRTRNDEACNTQNTCLTCIAASCSPQGCGNSVFNC
ncbi:hypothetical protein [uncultured Kordia sp.]|uniref:hypothetical protein n=1 Tax=uncultured Kordia sp. TaxID=507699 RepID=UPI0026261AAA|nr:hypothetical protein [uncultured Kordia sp.]